MLGRMHVVYAAGVLGIVVLMYGDKPVWSLPVWAIIVYAAMMVTNRWDRRNPW